jgi:tetratricopeptide (TPR) repeat protein
MLEGKNPFKEEEQIETLYNVLNKKVEFSRQIPGELEQIIRKALEKDKKNRYFSFLQLKDDLEQFRSYYEKWREKQASDNAGAGTEIIDSQEQEKLLKEIQKTSDDEGLGDLVNKIKGFKASTERVHTTGKKKIKWFALPLLIILILAAGFYIVNKMIIDKGTGKTGEGAAPTFYIYLHPFENKTGEKNLADKVNYLLTESLNQFKEFKAISKEEAASILENRKDEKVDLEKLSGKFKVSHELTGKITVLSGYYTIEGILSPTDKNRKEQRLTITGRGKNSILINQVDNLSRRVYRIFFPKKAFNDFGFKKVSRIYGTDWKVFSDFYLGYYYSTRREAEKAKRYLIKARDLLISKYSLAELLYFSGDRSKALKLVNDLVNRIDFLTQPMKHRVLALKARLDFDFAREISNLEKLKNDFLFSKEVFLELGEAYFHKGNAEKALEYYKKALELNRNYSPALNHMGYCYSYLGNHTKAIQAFEEYRTLDRTANSFDSLGDGYFYAGELIDSESLKGLAVSTDEKSVPWAYTTLVDINILKARYNEAEKLLKKYQLLRRTREYEAEVLAKKAYIYYVNRDYQQALKTINRSRDTFDSADITNETAEAHWLRGIILLASDHYEDSHLELDWLEDFTKKYKLSKENFSQPFKYYIHLEALIMEHDGEIVKAEENFKFLMSMKPQLSYWTTYYNYQFFHTQYAAFLMRNRKYPEALQEIDQCLEFNRNYIPALWLKADTLEKSDDPQEQQRETIYRKIAELYGEAAETNYLRNRLKEKEDLK